MTRETRRRCVCLLPRALPPGIAIKAPGGASPLQPGGKKGKGQHPSGTGLPPQGGGFLSSAASEMPAIASSKDELIAVLKLAGLKKPKPARVDRAWWALTSGESRSSNGDSAADITGGDPLGTYYARGGALAARVAVAGLLRNPDFGALLALALAMAVLLCRRAKRLGGGGRTGEEEATSAGGSSTRAGRPLGAADIGDGGGGGSNGDDGGDRSVRTVNGHIWKNGSSKLRAVRGLSSSLSPRRRAGN